MKHIKNYISKYINLLNNLYTKLFKKIYPDPPAFIFNSEYYNIAWGLNHYGYYITPDGMKYSYNSSRYNKWNFYEKIDDTSKISFIKKDKLQKNLNNCIVSYSKCNIEHETVLSMIDDLINSESNSCFTGCDMGSYSKSLLVFDSSNDTYKRILLECSGDFQFILNSENKLKIYDMFGQKEFNFNDIFRLESCNFSDKIL